jgi:hypothetical protein
MESPRSVQQAVAPVASLIDLVDELLDAHGDTVRLASEAPDDPRWQAHIGYLRDLQRLGKETMAHFTSGSPDDPT